MYVHYVKYDSVAPDRLLYFQRLLGNSTVVLTANRISKLLLSQYNQDHPETARFLPIFIAYNYSI